MEILERPTGTREGFASLDNIGFCLLEVNLEGDVYTYSIPGISEHCEVERVDNKWKIRAYDDSLNCIEYVIPRDVLVGWAWYNIKESLWENSIYADTIRRYKEFFSIPCSDKDITKYKTSKGFHYYVTKFGEMWSTENMIKLKGGIDTYGYRHVNLGSEHNVKVHRLVAHHFVRVPEDLLAQGLTEETLVVNHLDGNKLNNNWRNLEWTTQNGNMTHASATGLMHTTIDGHLLEHVFKRLEEGWSNTDISRETGICAATISQIRHGTLPRYRTDKYTWPKSSVNARMKESRDELAMKCVQMFNQDMSYQAIADKLGFNSTQPVRTLIGTVRDLITRKLPPRQDQRAKLDEDTILSIYDDFVYTDMSNSEIGRKYNISRQTIYDLRVGNSHSDLAREYITSKGLSGYWKGFSPPK